MMQTERELEHCILDIYDLSNPETTGNDVEKPPMDL